MKKIFILFQSIFLVIFFNELSFAQRIRTNATVVLADKTEKKDCLVKYRFGNRKVRFKEPSQKRYRAITLNKIEKIYNDTVMYEVQKINSRMHFLTQKIESGDINLYRTGELNFINKGNYEVLPFTKRHIKRLSYLFFEDSSTFSKIADTTTSILAFSNTIKESNKTPGSELSTRFKSIYNYNPSFMLKLSVFAPGTSLEVRLNNFFTISSGFHLSSIIGSDTSITNWRFRFRNEVKYYYNQKARVKKLMPTYNYFGRYLSLSHDYFIFTETSNIPVAFFNHGWHFSNLYKGFLEFFIGFGVDAQSGNYIYFSSGFKTGYLFNNKRYKR